MCILMYFGCAESYLFHGPSDQTVGPSEYSVADPEICPGGGA